MSASLYDALTRHQIYLEGLKAWQYSQLNLALAQADKDIRQKLATTNHDKLSDMNKAELIAFVLLLRKSQSLIFNRYAQSLLKFLKAFMSTDRKLITAIFNTVEPITPPMISEDAMFSRIINAPVPANGMTIPTMINTYSSKAVTDIVNQVNKGYANNLTTSETLALISGTSLLGNKDGIISKIFNGGKGVVATVVQAVTSNTQDIIQTQVFKEYDWSSVIDNVTTEICQERNGNRYPVGDGPLPPAHYGCRSKTIPVTDNQDIPSESFGVWAQRQPSAILQDMFGLQSSKSMLKSSASSLVFSNANPITLDQFAGKRSLILSE